MMRSTAVPIIGGIVAVLLAGLTAWFSGIADLSLLAGLLILCAFGGMILLVESRREPRQEETTPFPAVTHDRPTNVFDAEAEPLTVNLRNNLSTGNVIILDNVDATQVLHDLHELYAQTVLRWQTTDVVDLTTSIDPSAVGSDDKYEYVIDLGSPDRVRIVRSYTGSDESDDESPFLSESESTSQGR